MKKLDLYCLVYAKTPNFSDDTKNNKSIIYVSTWKFSNDKIHSNTTREIKIFSNDIDVRVRGGKFGDDKVFIIYNFTSPTNKGKHPNVFIFKLPNFEYIKKDVYYKDLLLNTCEDFKTFDDGVLIWANSNIDGKLVINKIGSPKLDDSYDDVNHILTKQDIIDYDNEMNQVNQNGKENESPSSNFWVKFGIALGIIFGVIILLLIAFLIWKYIKRRKISEQSINSLKGPLVYN